MKNHLEVMGRLALFRDQETEPGVPATTGGVAMDFESGSGLTCRAEAVHDGDTVHGPSRRGGRHTWHHDRRDSLPRHRHRCRRGS